MKHERLTVKFIEIIPDQLDESVIYVSMRYAACMHRCACGCGRDVVTPLSPTDWQLFFDGKSITLDPSIGNWSYPCRSHYWIVRNEVRWAGAMSDAAIERGRIFSRTRKGRYYDSSTNERAERLVANKPEAIANNILQPLKVTRSIWQRVLEKLSGK